MTIVATRRLSTSDKTYFETSNHINIHTTNIGNLLFVLVWSSRPEALDSMLMLLHPEGGGPFCGGPSVTCNVVMEGLTYVACVESTQSHL